MKAFIVILVIIALVVWVCQKVANHVNDFEDDSINNVNFNDDDESEEDPQPTDTH